MNGRFKLVATGLTLATALSATSVVANADAIPPEIDVMRRIAASFDSDGDGKISLSEFEEFTRLVWMSMDTNEDGQVSKDEFMEWDPGFSYVAEQHGKAEDFSDLKRDIFDYWDKNSDGIATKEEVMLVADAEFRNSDADGDGFVTGRDLAFGSPTFSAFIFGAGPASN